MDGNFLISRNDWMNVVLCYGLSLPLFFFWNSALILLLYFIFNIVLPDGMNHPSLCIFFFLWCDLACEQLDARTLQKCDNWCVHNCVKFVSIVPLFYVGCRLRIKVCEIFFIHTRTSMHYDSLRVHKSMNSLSTYLLSWVGSWASSMQNLDFMILLSQLCMNLIVSKCLRKR
jgi:hypothetical protein